MVDDDPDVDPPRGLRSAWSQGIGGHLAFDPARHRSMPTRADALIEEFLEHGVVERRPALRGE